MSLLGTIKRSKGQWDFILILASFFLFLSLNSKTALARVAGESPYAELIESEGQDLEAPIFNFNKWDHNFVWTFGMARGSWTVDQLGPIDGQEFESKAYFGKFQYSFHLPIFGDFGYVLGSSFGYYWERRLDETELHRVSAIHFPGVHLGLVYSLTPYFRVLGGVETYLERLDEFAVSTNNSSSVGTETRSISLTMRPNFDWIFAMDVFYSGTWGIRLEGHQRKVISIPPLQSEGQVIGARLTKRDTWIGLGLIFHLFST